MKKAGIIILCRYNSTRLPGKVLTEIEGKPLLLRIYQRLIRMIDREQIVVATSDQASDDPIEEFCQQTGIQIYRGSLSDVAGRFLSAARHYQFDLAVRINGDNLFVDLETLEEMIHTAQDGRFDFLTNVKDRTYPYGMSIEIVDVDFYASVSNSFSTDHHREHVTIYLYDHPEIGKRKHFYNTRHPELKGVQLAIDTPADLEQAQKILQQLNGKEERYTLADLSKIISAI